MVGDCAHVLEDIARSTTTLTCTTATVTDDELDFVGIRLSNDSLQDILDSVSLGQVPSVGMTIGIVRSPEP